MVYSGGVALERAHARLFIAGPDSASLEARSNMFSKTQCRGQSRRLDSEKIDKTRHSMFAFAVDAEIARGLARADDLGAHASIARAQCAARQTGPVTADRLIEHC